MIDRFKSIPPLYGLGKELCILYLAQMINAIELLQVEDIAHRDLKPLNVMIDDNFNIKLIDFGEAKHVNDPEIGEKPEEEEEKKSEKSKNSDEDDGDFAFGEDDEDQNSDANAEFQPALLMRKDTFVGTYNYLSPEVIKREKHTVAIDIWALGLIYFKMRIGKPAFPG